MLQRCIFSKTHSRRCIIFLETDPLFRLVYSALTDLDQNKRTASVYIDKIVNSENTIAFTAHRFGRTAAAVYRMVMLEACRIAQNLWPAGPKSRKRNLAAMQREVANPPPPLTMNAYMAKLYYSSYDSLFPHFYVEKLVNQSQQDFTQITATKRMVVFDANFQGVSEIATTVHIQVPQVHSVRGDVRVTYSRASTDSIVNGSNLHKLQMLCNRNAPLDLVRVTVEEEVREEESESEEGESEEEESEEEEN